MQQAYAQANEIVTAGNCTGTADHWTMQRTMQTRSVSEPFIIQMISFLRRRVRSDAHWIHIPSKYDSLVNSLQECYDMVRNNRAELDVPPETEQNVQQEYPQDQYPAEEYPQDTYEQDTYGQDDYLDDGNSYPDDMPISDYDIQEDDTLD